MSVRTVWNTSRKLIAATAAGIMLAAGLGACGSSNASTASLDSTKGKTTKIVVGVCPGPYGDMVKNVFAPLLKDDG